MIGFSWFIYVYLLRRPLRRLQVVWHVQAKEQLS